MQHIHLSDDSYILHTSKGMTTLTRKSFNFHKIKTLIKKGVDESEILPLLEIPDMPNGIFELYLHADSDTLIIKHIRNGGIFTEWKNLNNANILLNADAVPLTFMGVYVSEKDIMADWPEYLL